MAVEAMENDSSMHKRDRLHDRGDDLQWHFDKLEKDVRQLSQANCLQLSDSNIAFFGDATKAQWNENSLFCLTNQHEEAYMS